MKAGPTRRENETRLFRDLVAAAVAARRHAYAPYSRFKVGAALLTAQGRLYTGANVENASYGLSLCAERVALAKAVSDGQVKFRALAVVAAQTGLTPCGACRQVLAEFGDFPVICADARRPRRATVYRVSELLPHAFQL